MVVPPIVSDSTKPTSVRAVASRLTRALSCCFNENHMGNDEFTYWDWFYGTLGSMYLVLLPLLAIACLLLALILLKRGEGPALGGTIVLLALLPSLVGLFAFGHGLLNTLTTWSTGDGRITLDIIADGVAGALTAPIFAFVLSLPIFLAAIIGGIIRSLSAQSNNLETEP